MQDRRAIQLPIVRTPAFRPERRRLATTTPAGAARSDEHAQAAGVRRYGAVNSNFALIVPGTPGRLISVLMLYAVPLEKRKKLP